MNIITVYPIFPKSINERIKLCYRMNPDFCDNIQQKIQEPVDIVLYGLNSIIVNEICNRNLS